MPAGPESRAWLHVRVEGRVHGVGFRWFVLRTAEPLGVIGWVRNLSDGAVEVSAVGTMASVGRLRDRLLAGPPHARVERLVDLHGGSEPRSERFEIVGGDDAAR
ncbi:MAG: acylphosphatase [Gemmatirosa sp.]